MRISKLALLLLALVFMQCNNDDESPDPSEKVIVSPVLDWDLIKNLSPGSEASYDACNFGQDRSIPNEEFTSVVTLNDTLFFNPTTNPGGDTLLYLELSFDPTSSWADYLDLSINPVSPGDSVGQEITIEVIDNENTDVELKYDLRVMIGTDQGRFGPYLIDPKIRIPN